MRELGKWLGRFLLLVLVLVLFLWLGPREQVSGVANAPNLPEAAELDAWLEDKEAQVPDLRPSSAKRITWAGEVGARTPLSIIYLHGFSASNNEMSPVQANIAKELGANMFETRLAGHGRDGAAMAEPRAEAWLDDVAEAMEIGRALGDEVVILGVSTGGTLAAWAATQPQISDALAGIILISPNFKIANPMAALLHMPFARAWVPLLAGEERKFTPRNEAHGAQWTTQYPTVATVTMATAMRESLAQDFSEVDVPAYFIFSEHDTVVSADATRAMLDRWGAPVSVEMPGPMDGVDPDGHVIVGDILSPAHTPIMTNLMVDWIRALP